MARVNCAGCDLAFNRVRAEETEEFLWHPTLLARLFEGGKLELQADFYSGCHRQRHELLGDSPDLDAVLTALGKIEGLEVAIIGDITHSRVVRSNIYCLSKLGAKVRLCGPGTMLPPGIEKLGNVKVYTNMLDAIKDVDVVMMLRIQLERQSNIMLPSLREYARFYGLNLNNRPLMIH